MAPEDLNKKPVSLHSRGAWADCVDISVELAIKKAVFHWFSRPLDVLRKLLDQGYYVLTATAHILKALSAVTQMKDEKEETVAEKNTENARLLLKI